MDQKGNQELNNTTDNDIMDLEPVDSLLKPPVISKAKNAITASNVWGISPKSAIATETYMKKIRMTHGMFANVPILCKDTDCPYIEACEIAPQERVLGQRCPQEAAVILARFEMYCNHFGIDISGPTFKPSDVVDAGLVRDLVDIEVQMLRAENKTAIRGDFLGLTINTVDNKGKAWYEETVTPEAQYKNTLMDKRFKILNLLNSTRKDKAAMAKVNDNPSVKAVSIFKKINEAMSAKNKMDVYDVEEAVIVEHSSKPEGEST
jgi:hypothetical protein